MFNSAKQSIYSIYSLYISLIYLLYLHTQHTLAYTTQLCPHLYKCSRSQATQGFAARTKTNKLDMLGVAQYVISSRRRFYVEDLKDVVIYSWPFILQLDCAVRMLWKKLIILKVIPLRILSEW